MAVEAPIGEDVKRATADTLERVAQILAGRVYSPRIKLLEIDHVTEATGLSERTIYRKVAEGTFPRPMKDMGRNVWREATLIAWMESRDPDHGKDWA